MHVSDQKDELRQSIVQRIKRLSDADLLREGRSVSRRLLPHIPSGSAVCAYVPLRTEANISLLLHTILERKDALYLPCFEDNRLVYRQTASLDGLKPGALKIPEPPKTAPVLDRETENIIVLVPGRAFSLGGARLGRGNGGYDRWIAKQRRLNPSTQYIGIALECQIVREIPLESHDQMMDAIVTARGFTECKT